MWIVYNIQIRKTASIFSNMYHFLVVKTLNTLSLIIVKYIVH
jgi:hypothetical protein